MPLPPQPPSAHRPERAGRAIWWLLAAIAVLWIAPLGTRSLIATDEGRYADLALHMFQSGDWVTPRLNGLLYFYKPPLVYWAGAVAHHLFGINEFAARLWAGLSGLGCVAAAGWAAQAWWGRDGALRAMVLTASMTWLILNSHMLTLDTSLTLGTTLALCGLLRGFAPGTGAAAHRRALLLAWAGMAVAVLSKGLVGIVIPGAALVLYTLISLARGERAGVALLWRGLEWRFGPLLFLLLVLPWFVLVSMRNPGFVDFFFVQEHWQRYTSTVHHREGAWWYFVPWLLLGSLPWTGVLAAAAWRGLRAPRAAVQVAPPVALRPVAFLWCWCGFVFVFFSLSGSKLPSYVLPMFPALALLAVVHLEGLPRLRAHLWPALLLWLALLALWLLAPRFASAETPAWKIHTLLGYLSAGAGVFALGWAVAWWLAGRSRPTGAVVALSLAHVAAALITLQGHDTFGQLKSADAMAPRIVAALPPGAPAFSVRTYDHTLPFYLKHEVVLVEYVDEFAYGLKAEPARGVPTLAAFVQRWRELPDAAALMRTETFDELQRQGLPMREIFRDARRVVVVRR
jgi:4-amino-4-deoxy-L-arabinose transferase-like glycosyltransferase